MSKFRIIQESDDKVFYVEEKGLYSLFLWWSRWRRSGGSFGDEDYVYRSIKEAEKAIESYTSRKVKKIVKYVNL